MRIEALDAHALIWARMRYALNEHRVPQALLWVGPRTARILQFAYRFMATILCHNTPKPCGECQGCRLLIQGTHPDIHEVTEDAPGGAIKIDQVRELQHAVYQRPQCANHQFVLIHPASQLNRQAANALLHILEEPPSHTVFILIADQMGPLPATIISRCQRTIFAPPERLSRIEQPDYLMIGEYYPDASSRRSLFDQRAAMIATLCDLLEGKTDVCCVASAWSAHTIEDLLWFFYLLTATLIVYQLARHETSHAWAFRVMDLLVHRSPQPVHFFTQLDTILEFTRINNQNIPLNKTLVLETLLLGYLD